MEHGHSYYKKLLLYHLSFAAEQRIELSATYDAL